MGSRLPPYPEYRDSGLAWLPRLPSHWELIRGKAILREVDERSISGAEELLTVSHKTGVTPRRLKNVTMFKAESYVGHKLARPKDIVMNTMWAWMAATGVSGHLGIVSPSYGVYRPRGENLDSRYLDYLLRTPLLKAEYHRRSKGIRASRLRLYADQFLDIRFPVPPLDEQSRIADYLVAHGRLTNRLIRNRRRLIASLQQRNQAIIRATVTRGLNLGKPMKATGITTLPQVPSHWDICLLKRMAMLQRGYDLPEDQRQPGPYPVVSSAGPIGFHALAKAAAPGVVTGRYGSTGKIHFIEHDFWPHNTSLFVVNFFGNLPRFIYYLLQTVSTEEHATKAAVPGIDRKDLHETPVAAVPLDEQADIVTYLDAVALETRTVIERTERHIELLRAYHERLIADLVSGARDVREAPLPPTVPPEMEDDASVDVDEVDEEEDSDVDSDLVEVDE